MEDEPKDWELKLRYGKLKTKFRHFSVLADGVVGRLVEEFECRPGRAWMSLKMWATDTDESICMIQAIGNQVGFSVDGRIEVYDTAPEQPPGDKPYGYDIRFYPYNKNA